MKIGIFYDTLLARGGAERVAVELANGLGAEIVTSGYDSSSLVVKPVNEVHDIGNVTAKFSKRFGYLVEAPIRFILNRNRFKYDVHLHIGFTSIFAADRADRARNVWYCLTPNRMLYDLREHRLATHGLPGRLALRLYAFIFARLDRRAIRNMGLVVSQTETVRARVERFYGRESSVIYAPVDTRAYGMAKVGDYFLAVSRLYSDKRMPLVARAFVGIDEELVMVGDGPERSVIASLIASSSNITLLCNVPDATLRQLYASCRATVYMPIDEDYGLVPIESMASGKPCIASDEGGCRETVISGRTGLLIQPGVDAIREAVKTITSDWARGHAEDCVQQAKKFDIANCLDVWRDTIGHLDT